MGDVINFKNRTYTIFDIKDILEIIDTNCGQDIYEWLTNYLHDMELTIRNLEYNIEEQNEVIDDLKNEIENLSLLP